MDTGPERKLPVIRHAHSAEYPALSRLVCRLAAPLYVPFADEAVFERWCNHHYLPDHYVERANHGHVLVAVDDDILVGTVYVGYDIPQMSDADYYIGGLYVTEAGRGLGSRLLNVAQSYAFDDDKSVGLAEVAAPNHHALDFFSRHGFIDSGGHYGRTFRHVVFRELFARPSVDAT